MAAGDVAVLRAVGRFQDQNVVNTFHYEITDQGGPEAAQWQELADEWESTNAAAWLARHSDAYELIGIKVFTIKGDSQPPGFASVRLNGDVVGDPQESFICRTVTLYTDNANHRVRGRLMFSGGDEAMFDDTDGSVTGAEIALLNTLVDGFLTPIAGPDNTYKMVLYNKLLDVINNIIAVRGRITPSVVRSRRIRQFLIG